MTITLPDHQIQFARKMRFEQGASWAAIARALGHKNTFAIRYALGAPVATKECLAALQARRNERDALRKARRRDHARRSRDSAAPIAAEIDTRALIDADEQFGRLMLHAINAGLERDIAVDTETSGTERPAVYLPVATPDRPRDGQVQSLRNVAERLDRKRRRQFAEDLRNRRDAPAIKPPVGRFTILDVDASTCRYAMTEAPPYLFCGAPVQDGVSSYCPRHAARCGGRRLYQSNGRALP